MSTTYKRYLEMIKKLDDERPYDDHKPIIAALLVIADAVREVAYVCDRP